MRAMTKLAANGSQFDAPVVADEGEE